MKSARYLLLLLLGIIPLTGFAAPALDAITVTQSEGGAQTYSVTLQVLMLMTALTLLPSILLTMTSFTRIIVVLAILRQAIGTAQTPSNQILLGLALFLSFFIMQPVFEKVNDQALQPYLSESISVQQFFPDLCR